jgi:glycosidase
MKLKSTLVFVLISLIAKAQLLTWNPGIATDGTPTIQITMDANFGNLGLVGNTATDVYVHTGVITNLSATPSSWRYVKFNQNFNQPNASLQAESLGSNRWRFTIPQNIRAWYGVPDGETISRIAILFRSGNGSRVQRNRDGSDMYIPIFPSGIAATITVPFKQPTFNPIPEPITATIGQVLPITAAANQNSNMRLTLNGTQIATQNGVSTISANPTLSMAGNQRIIAEAELGGVFSRDTLDFFLPGATETASLPAGVDPNGVTYHNGGTAATLVLYAPNKSNVVVLGDFNDWVPGIPFQMKRTPDGLRYWLRIEGLTPGVEYAYQYLIDGVLKVADYNTEKILDPWNDPAIPATTYPNLRSYPTGKTTDIVSLLQPGKPVYNWKNNSFQRPDKRNIVVYELLVRDYSAQQNFQAVIDSLPVLARLGINTIHLMPFTEFENNNSWGYNPSFMFAVDKFYGPENKLRELVDSCHGRGIAVILDMVLNHQFGQSPMVRMYWDAANNRPAANSPWFNQVPTHDFNVGYDMNHEAPATIEFVERVMKHWLVKFRLDGFRWDLSKGFTQVNSLGNVGFWNQFDQSRVNIWQRIYDQSQAISPGCYMILEHLGNDDEEAELAKRGMLLWGKMTYEFGLSAAGHAIAGSNDQFFPPYLRGKNWNFQRAYHTTRWSAHGANNVPLLMSYAESHDEERVMHITRRWGNTGGQNAFPWLHNPRQMTTNQNEKQGAIFRMEQTAAFLFTIPGPKMIWQFGEYGYDAGINMCENFTTPNNTGCRTSPKPLVTAMPDPFFSETLPSGGFSLLNYKQNRWRNALYDTYSRIIRLRTADNNQYLSTFITNDVSFDLSGAFKWQRISSASLRIVVIGNFGVTPQSGSVTFPTTGVWQLYHHNVPAADIFGTNQFPGSVNNPNLTATQLTVNNATQSFSLPPGTFMVFIDRPAVLPINLLSFKAQRASDHINLVWRTNQERNTAGFEIERSMDGMNYEVVGKQASNNNPGLSVNLYRYEDRDAVALKAPHRIFYRIRMNDQNGEYTYSQVQPVDPAGGLAKTSVYPNPINNNSNLLIDFPQAGVYQIRVVNAQGQSVGTIVNGYREKGVQTIPLRQGAFVPSVLQGGTYYLRIEGAGKVETVPLVKVN